MSNMTCNSGTLWDYTLDNCDHDYKVLPLQSCSSSNSWERCNTTGQFIIDVIPVPDDKFLVLSSIKILTEDELNDSLLEKLNLPHGAEN